MAGIEHRVARVSDEFLAELAGKTGNKVEKILRPERQKLLEELANKDQVGVILMAHHQDDQYETVLQRVAWGSSLLGLGGIPVYKKKFLRPLLNYPKVPPL
jgi:tRNA(Ile)-lysidine synthase